MGKGLRQVMLSEGSLSVLGLILQTLPQDAVEFQNRLLNQVRVVPLTEPPSPIFPCRRKMSSCLDGKYCAVIRKG